MKLSIACGTLQEGLEAIAETLRPHGVRLWVMPQVPFQSGVEPHKRIALAAISRGETPPGLDRQSILDRQRSFVEILRSHAGDEIEILDPLPFCLDADGRSRIGDSGGSYYRDDDHLSPYGVKTLLRP